MLLPHLSALGWFHTLGSLPAIPLSLYMLVRHGRITPEASTGKAWLVFMLIGAISGLLVIKDAPGVAISLLSLGSLAVGSTVQKADVLGNHRHWIQTVALSTATFTLFVPSVTETLTRVPAGHPIAASPQAPLVVLLQLGLVVCLIVGVTLQLLFLKRAPQGTMPATAPA